MNKYLFLYFGGSEPASPEDNQAVMNAWMAYFGKLGDKVIDGGTPLAGRLSVGVASSQATGYSIIAAQSLEAARDLCDGHPHLASGGTLEILECVDMDMDMDGEDEDDMDEDEDLREDAM